MQANEQLDFKKTFGYNPEVDLNRPIKVALKYHCLNFYVAYWKFDDQNLGSESVVKKLTNKVKNMFSDEWTEIKSFKVPESIKEYNSDTWTSYVLKLYNDRSAQMEINNLKSKFRTVADLHKFYTRELEKLNLYTKDIEFIEKRKSTMKDLYE